MIPRVFLCSIFVFACLGGPASAGMFYKELNLVGGYSRQEDWTGRSAALKNSWGFEYYQKFSNDYGDYLTADLQLRAVYESLEDSRRSLRGQVHNAWLLYKLGYGCNIKLGHFDPAFGLEPVVDTHSTVLQTQATKNIGFKKDWGLALKGAQASWDYKLALQLGSGMSLHRRDGSFLATARVGSPANENLQGGISLLYGEVLQSDQMQTFPQSRLLSPQAVLKKRVGLDGQYLFGPCLFKGEVAYGRNQKEDVLGYLLEIDYTFPKYERYQVKLQFQSWIHELGKAGRDDSSLGFTLSYQLDADTTIRAAFLHDFNLEQGREDSRVLLQFYYYGV